MKVKVGRRGAGTDGLREEPGRKGRKESRCRTHLSPYYSTPPPLPRPDEDGSKWLRGGSPPAGNKDYVRALGKSPVGSVSQPLLVQRLLCPRRSFGG